MVDFDVVVFDVVDFVVVDFDVGTSTTKYLGPCSNWLLKQQQHSLSKS